MNLAPADSLGLPVLEGALPWLGHSLRFLRGTAQTYQTVRDRHGDLCWVSPSPGLWNLLVLNPAGFEVMREKSLSVNHYQELASLLLGRSVLTQDGATHRAQRNAMNKPFTPQGLTATGVGALMKRTMQRRIEALTARPEVTMMHETRELALDIIFQIMGIEEADLPDWRRQYERVTLAALPFKWEIPGTPAWTAARGRRWVTAALQQRIDAARARPDATGLLAEIVRGWDQENADGAESDLIDNLLLLALAGHETTATTMAWMASVLANRDDLWERLLDEAEAAGELPGTPAELTRHPFAEGLFRESLRLCPPVPVVSRRLTEPLEVLGRALPAGVEIAFPYLYYGREPSVYPDADQIRPERWAGRRPSPLETVAFSYGPHFCLGYHVAWMESVQFATALALAVGRERRLSLPTGMPTPTVLGLMRIPARRTIMSFPPRTALQPRAA